MKIDRNTMYGSIGEGEEGEEEEERESLIYVESILLLECRLQEPIKA